MFYVYKWYNLDNNEIFYVGKGCRDRYKDKKHRNKKFLEYVEKHHNVTSEIVQSFENEEEAFAFEHKLITTLKEQNMCSCNLDNGGKGGCNFIWTPEMREYKSKYNPMRDPLQKQRMSTNNPMKNPEIAKRVGQKHSKIIIYNNKEYTTKQLAEKFKTSSPAVWNWVQRGYAPDLKDCYYKDDGPKPFIIAIPAYKTKPVYIDDMFFESVSKASKFLCLKNSNQLIRHLNSDNKILGHTCKYANQQPSLETVK